MAVVSPKRLEEQPFGRAYLYPPNSEHGISMSMPTWESIIDYFEKPLEWKNEHIEWCYPRFFINRPIRELTNIALARTNVAADEDVDCFLFPTSTLARACANHIMKDRADANVDIVQFESPKNCRKSRAEVLNAAQFTMVIFPKDVRRQAMMFWVNFGGGLTTRHAIFAKDCIDYLNISSSNQDRITIIQAPGSTAAYSPPTPSWISDAETTATHIKSTIASLSTSENLSLPEVTADHVTLYSTGMSAIYHASEALQDVVTTSKVVAFGWVYEETIYSLKHSHWDDFIGYKRGTEEDLEDLESRLKAGERVGALFCELPSNVFLSSVSLQHLAALADAYGFVLVCDNTVSSFVNLDLIPYVDVMITSLTKMFSGASNVTGGSVIVNPGSRYYHRVQSALRARYESACVFPHDLEVLRHNSQHVRWRAQRCNQNALAIAQMLHDHPLVKQLNYPYFQESSPVYRKFMRKDGGYGPIMSIILNDEKVARCFYNKLNIPKGPSFGINFTIAVPFALLVHYRNRDKVKAYGLPEHTIRISIGLEDVEQVKEAIQKALASAVESVQSSNMLTTE